MCGFSLRLAEGKKTSTHAPKVVKARFTRPSGNQLPYPAYTSWVSRVDVQFVDAACWQQHVGAALDKRKLVEDVDLGTSKSVCEGSGLPVTIRSNPE